MTAERTMEGKRLEARLLQQCAQNPNIERLDSFPNKWRVFWLVKIRRKLIVKIADNWWIIPRSYLL